MNIFGSNDRTLRALGASHETEVGDRMVAMMKPDIGAYMRAPWKALPLVRDALAMPPRKKWRGNCQRVRLDTDLDQVANSKNLANGWRSIRHITTRSNQRSELRRAQPRHVSCASIL